MNTKLIEIENEKDEAALAQAAELLQNGGLCAIPTETVYGLAANAFDGAAVARIFEAKGRPADNPLIVHIADLDMLSDLVREVPQSALELARAYWPGPLTMILPKSDRIPHEVSAGLDTVAVRMPSHPIAAAIIRKSGLPLAAPSANLSGSPSPTTAAHVVADLRGRVEGIVCADDCGVGVESTVVTLCTQPPRLLRPGAITVEMLEKVLGKIDVDDAILHQLKADAKVSSPGMKYKHYAPKAKVILCDGTCEGYIHYVNTHADAATCALCFAEEAAQLSCKTLVYGSLADDAAQAHALFDALRQLDAMGIQIAYAHAPRKSGVGLAVYNRLIRAAAFEVVQV